ncbi:hypothetical protein G6F62_007035 [Rhizopus arrhizus]|nr:hypothetical protein G6F23_006419 [Rhizopus arrhizus]KAG0766924.1 hypothetical protein G6F24_003215 [Rhizopus arrhizus]KAG0783844.1 hypothetical protein G6F21_010282 [Rhizopus arrhizus]KAG0789478.1 hypothetical protein G6F22_006693 [Rhizopus arrhizus]KAG0809947.1 hypothetical protein G6F20_008355 [Rhizopus arrhizus]
MGIVSSKSLSSRTERNCLPAKRLFKKTTKSSAMVTTTLENDSFNTLKSVQSVSPVNSTCSRQKYRYVNGRRHHDDDEVSYVLPNDDDESDRIHQQHWILQYIFQCNFHAPLHPSLEQGITVLDSACGPATWTLEMAKTFPNSSFYGIDISSVFPENIKPSNIEFLTGNIAKSIPFEDNTFDYIHQRLVIVGLTEVDWQKNLAELYRVLKPGGYIELVEPVVELEHCGPLTRQNEEALHSVLIARNMCPQIGQELHDRLLSTGFENITVIHKQIPMNHSGKAGELWWQDFKHVSLNLRPVMAKKNPAFEDPHQFEAYLEKSGLECKEYKTCTKWFINYAQKPLH